MIDAEGNITLPANTTDVEVILTVTGNGESADSKPMKITLPSGQENLAAGKSVSASTVHNATYSPEKAIDGDYETRWAALDGTLPQTFTIDLGKAYYVNSTEIEFEMSGRYLMYYIETSTDNENWEMFADRTDNNRPEKTCVDAVNPSVKAQYVRITVTDAQKNQEVPDWASIREVRVYGSENPDPAIELPYEDVAETDWFYDVVYYNYVNGYMTGKSAAIFAPDDTLTRAELTSILYRINGEPEVAYEAAFTDVAEDAWYASPVLWAYKNGVVNGYAEGDFRPDAAITREQLAVIMHNYAAAKDYEADASTELDAFNDADQVGDWAKPAVQWAVATGVISGKNGVSLDPQGNATRAEAAAIIQRFMENIAK